jgi:predicted nucleotidyltransferase
METGSINSYLQRFFEQRKEVLLVYIFGSAARNRLRFDSDLDLAIYCHSVLSSDVKRDWIIEVGHMLGRSVDLVDLRTLHGRLLSEILQTGTLILNREPAALASLLQQSVSWNADLRPYTLRMQKRQLERMVCE